MTTALEPLVVIDVQDREQWERITSTPGLLTQLQNWARSHGIDPDDTYRVEVYLDDPDRCAPARREPYNVPLNSMPPTPNGGEQ